MFRLTARPTAPHNPDCPHDAWAPGPVLATGPGISAGVATSPEAAPAVCEDTAPMAKRSKASSVSASGGAPPPLFGSLAPQTISCGDTPDKRRALPAGCVDLIYIAPPFNSNRNYEIFWP